MVGRRGKRTGSSAARRSGGARLYNRRFCEPDDATVVEELIDYHGILDDENLPSLMLTADVKRITDNLHGINYVTIAEQLFGLRIKHHANDFVFNMVVQIITKQLYAVFAVYRSKYGQLPERIDILRKIKNEIIRDFDDPAITKLFPNPEPSKGIQRLVSSISEELESLFEQSDRMQRLNERGFTSSSTSR
jgi:hypothetical protein